MPSKFDKTQYEIDSAIERVRSLVADGKQEAADTVANETDELIVKLPVRMRSERIEALQEALTPPDDEDGSEVATLETQDWHTVDGAEELVTATAESMANAVRSELDSSERAYEMAREMLRLRVQMTNKHGVPDVTARAQATRDAAAAVYEAAGASFRSLDGERPDYDQRTALKATMRKVQNRMSDVVVLYLKGLDDDTDEYADRFPLVAAAYPNLSPSEAVWTYYDNIGMPIPRKGRLEKKREDDARRLEIEESDDEAEDTADTGTPDERVSSGVRRLRQSVKAITPDDVEHASDATKREVVETLSEISQQIKLIVPKAL